MRNIFVVILLALSAALPVTAQTRPINTPFGQAPAPAAPANSPAMVGPGAGFQQACTDCSTRVFALRYIDTRTIGNLLKPFDVTFSLEQSLHAISVKAPASTLTAIEDMIKRFDVPANAAKQVEVTAFLVLASPQSEPDTIPAALKPVIDQLRSVMAYKSYRVLDTIMATGKENDLISEAGTTPKLTEAGPSPTYIFKATPRITGEGADRSIYFDNLHLDFQNTGGLNSLGTSVDVKKGQQVVIGKTTVQDRAIILVLSGRILD